MSTHDDDNIEFDFFDEPETVEATQRRRLPRLESPAAAAAASGRRARRCARRPASSRSPGSSA